MQLVKDILMQNPIPQTHSGNIVKMPSLVAKNPVPTPAPATTSSQSTTTNKMNACNCQLKNGAKRSVISTTKISILRLKNAKREVPCRQHCHFSSSSAKAFKQIYDKSHHHHLKWSVHHPSLQKHGCKK